MGKTSDIRSFEDLEVWRMGRNLRTRLYALAREIPTTEAYNLAPQIRRAAVSITANIAEGYGRYHYKENVQCCRISRGSAYELIDHLMTCKDQKYLGDGDFTLLREGLLSFIRMLNAYIKSIGRQAPSSSEETS
jgi:four helix bundle protein